MEKDIQPKHPFSQSGSTLCSPIAKNKDSSDNRSYTSSRNPSQKSAINLPKDKPRRIFHWFLLILGLRETNQIAGTFSSEERYWAIQRALLLNIYPVGYIILWLPAIANRLIEATGHSVTVMQFVQVTRQLVGLAHAWTYGLDKRVGEQLTERFSGRQAKNCCAYLAA